MTDQPTPTTEALRAPESRQASNYDAERVDGMKTLGDAARHRRRHGDAFTAGAHWALDSLLSQAAGMPAERWLDAAAADLLRRAKDGGL